MSVTRSRQALADLNRIHAALPPPFVGRYQVSLSQIDNYLKTICQNFPTIPASCNVRRAVYGNGNATTHGYALTWGHVEAVFRVLRQDPRAGGDIEVVSYSLIPPRRVRP